MKAVVAAARAHILLEQGDLAGALHWAQVSGLSSDDNEMSYLREREYLTLARVRIVQGRDDPAGPYLPDGLRLLSRLLEDAEETRTRGVTTAECRRL